MGGVAAALLAALAPACCTQDLSLLELETPHRYGCAAEGVELPADGGTWSVSFPCADGADSACAREHGQCCERGWSFDQALPSWNVDVPDGASFRVEVSVVTAPDAPPSPWLDLGGWGEWPAEDLAATAFDGGRTEVDILRCDVECHAATFRLRTRGPAGATVRVARFRAVFTRSAALPAYVEQVRAAGDVEGLSFGAGRIAYTGCELRPSSPLWPPNAPAVALRHQYAEGPELGSRICSPTSVAMVLDAHGVDVPTREVAALLYDREHDLYGNWNRAVQGAYVLGVPGFVTRLSNWYEAYMLLDRFGPLVISIAAEEGQLRGAPYPRTSGHLMVLAGFDLETDEALVLDPATPVGDEAPRRYALDDLETVWLARGGFTYVLGR